MSCLCLFVFIGITRPGSGRTDGLLWLCFRLLRCGPGDDILHSSLLVVVKVSAHNLRLGWVDPMIVPLSVQEMLSGQI